MVKASAKRLRRDNPYSADHSATVNAIYVLNPGYLTLSEAPKTSKFMEEFSFASSSALDFAVNVRMLVPNSKHTNFLH